MPEYGKVEYWDERYKSNDTTFDWFVSLEPLKEILLPLIKSDTKILNVGCGNSRLSAQLYDAGAKNITNIDISEVVISQMKQRYKELDAMQWIRMDATRMEFPDSSFDLVIDKATTDSILCGSNSFHTLYQLNKQISRIMKKGSKFVCISYGQQDTRIDHFRRKKLRWEVEHRAIDKPIFTGGGGGGGGNSSDASPSSHYHVYICTKLDAAASGSADGDGDEEDDDEDEDDFYDKFQANTTSNV